MNTAQTVETDDDSNASGPVQQFLTFSLANEDYGINILKVREIKGWKPVTRIPNSASYVLGILNMRGTIVPVIDLRMRFKLENIEYNATTVVIILAVESAHSMRTIGIVVDSVSDVLDVQHTDMKAAPDFGAKIDTKFMDGIAAVDQRMVMILDIDKLLSEDELAALPTS